MEEEEHRLPAEWSSIFGKPSTLHGCTSLTTESSFSQIQDMVIAMADRFPGGRLVFDAVGKFGREKLMKGTLKNMGMKDISGLFYVIDESELKDLSPKVKLNTKKSYMQGYYPLNDPNIKGIHHFLAKLCDNLAKMYVYRMEFTA